VTSSPPTRKDHESAVYHPKALIIGIDGGGFDIVDPMVAAGALPNLARLLRRGSSAATTCTWPAHTAPGWSSFVSASNPGGHGIYQFYDTQDRNYGAVIRRADDLGRSSVWDWLAAQGYTLGLINIPMSHPPQDRPGYQITWPLIQTLRYSRPASLLSELSRTGLHFKPDLATMFRGDLNYLDEALANVVVRAQSAIHLMRQRPTDVVMIVFTEADRVCHHYWHFCDTGHPRHEDPPAESGWDQAIGRIYGAIDVAIGELVAEVTDDTSVVVVSDHGLGTGQHELAVHQLLEQAGLLVTAPPGEPDGQVASWFSETDRRVDFTRTAVYSPTPGCYGLNVNLAGRQCDGTVSADDKQTVLAQAADLMSSQRLPDGEPVFRAVVPREVGYPGPHTESAPDLLLIPRDESVMVTTALGGELWRPSWQTGLHRYRGMWIHASPRIIPGRLAGTLPLIDLIPTLLTDLGASWPANVHGQPVRAVFSADLPEPGHLPDDGPFRPAAGGAAASCTEDSYVSERLREMGYI
jgi:predicted AlkP superfamily phosphohydrolase/phosphomutase